MFVCLFVCSTLPQLAADKFPHVPLGVASGAASGLSHGVLHRQLITSSVHYAKGVWPYKAQPLYRLFRWVGDIWVLYNQILKELGLSSVATGEKDGRGSDRCVFLKVDHSILNGVIMWSEITAIC